MWKVQIDFLSIFSDYKNKKFDIIIWKIALFNNGGLPVFPEAFQALITPFRWNTGAIPGCLLHLGALSLSHDEHVWEAGSSSTQLTGYKSTKRTQRLRAH